ncbi:MAG: hypothetical protein ACLGIC_08355 [Acidimicrobiia bacterium]
MRRRLAAALVAGLLVASCGDDGGDAAPVEAATAPETDPLDFVAPDVRGGQVTGADLAGQDLVIWFWAPW